MKITYSGVLLNNTKSKFQKFSLYPNPASDNVKLAYSSTNQLVSIHVIDLQGKVILKEENITSHSTINISSLSNGLYFIKIFDKNSNSLKTKKLIVK